MTFDRLGEIAYKPMGKHVKDLTGKRFGRLTVEKYIGIRKRQAIWLCKCECGNDTYTVARQLMSGGTTSCGCAQSQSAYNTCIKRNETHGFSKKEQLYSTWKSMRCRCFNKQDKSYKNYGERGITICEEWKDYSAFREWALSNGYIPGLSIDRIDNNGNYCPENCRWTTVAVQNSNKRNNVFLAYNGETYSPTELAKIKNIPVHRIYDRRHMGWTDEKIITYQEKSKLGAHIEKVTMT